MTRDRFPKIFSYAQEEGKINNISLIYEKRFLFSGSWSNASWQVESTVLGSIVPSITSLLSSSTGSTIILPKTLQQYSPGIYQ